MEEASGPEGPCVLQDELRYLLNRWDPAGVYDQSLDFPAGEYDCWIGPLLTKLAHLDSRADLRPGGQLACSCPAAARTGSGPQTGPPACS